MGQLVTTAVRLGRGTRPDLGLGVCGEHAGDPASIHFFAGVGLDYVSCSPPRVPVARLEAGRAPSVVGTSVGSPRTRDDRVPEGGWDEALETVRMRCGQPGPCRPLRPAGLSTSLPDGGLTGSPPPAPR